jgi:hypothetical protein
MWCSVARIVLLDISKSNLVLEDGVNVPLKGLGTAYPVISHSGHQLGRQEHGLWVCKGHAEDSFRFWGYGCSCSRCDSTQSVHLLCISTSNWNRIMSRRQGITWLGWLQIFSIKREKSVQYFLLLLQLTVTANDRWFYTITVAGTVLGRKQGREIGHRIPRIRNKMLGPI